MMMQSHAIADAKLGYACPCAHDRAGRFMPQNSRRRHGAVMNFFDVGRANTTNGHSHQNLRWADARDRDFFQAQVIDSAINDSPH